MAKTFPIIEIFGPTIQGEGALIGQQTAFVRFGGCDYRCSWCDTLYAVLPEQVRANRILMTLETIVAQIHDHATPPQWVTLSGGNPLLHDLGPLVTRLHAAGFRVTAETQGTVYHPWANNLDLLTISPKPPSSGMVTDWDQLARFLTVPSAVLKVVVFDDRDYAYAQEIAARGGSRHPFYLQVGNVVGHDGPSDLLTRLDWLTARVLTDPVLRGAIVLPQLHVLLWGNKRGV